MNPEEAAKAITDCITAAENLGLAPIVRAWQTQYTQTDAEKDVRVTVIGDFNHGKSSLINALIGEKLLPSGITPTTKIDTFVRFCAPHPSVHARRSDGSSASWPLDEYTKKLDSNSEDIISGFDGIIIETGAETFDKSCVFVDTPGLNDASLTRENFLQKFLSRADILIFVLDALQAVTRSELSILRHAMDNLPDIARFLVINKCDRLDDSEWLDVCHYVEKTTAPLLGDDLFYMVSSKNTAVGDMDRLRTALEKSISDTKCTAQHRFRQRALREMTDILCAAALLGASLRNIPPVSRQSLTAAHRANTLSEQLCSTIIDSIDAVSERLKIQTQSLCTSFHDAFMQAMPREIDKSSIADAEAFFEDFIDDRTAQHAQDICTDFAASIAEILSQILKAAIPDTAANYSCPDTAILFPKVHCLIRQPANTGAFERSFSMLDLGVTGLFTGRMARNRRDALKKQAAAAIHSRTAQMQAAFSHDINTIQHALSALMREFGTCLPELICDLICSENIDSFLQDFESNR